MKIATLSRTHDRRAFTCGHPDIDDFLRTRASQNQKACSNQTYVAVDDTDALLGFVTVQANSLKRDELGDGGKKLPPFPLPVLLLGQLGVDLPGQGTGIGVELFKHACRLAQMMRDMVGCVGVVIDSVPDKVEWYKKRGCVVLETSPSPAGRVRMFLVISRIPEPPAEPATEPTPDASPQ